MIKYNGYRYVFYTSMNYLMKKIFSAIDGPKKGSNLHSGEIGILLQNCTGLSTANFPPITFSQQYLSDLLNNCDLSSDQLYLRDIIIGISSGDISESLVRRSQGKLGYARWLTTANRILRVYITFENHTEDLSLICKYIIHVYARIWFAVKAKPEFYVTDSSSLNVHLNTQQLNDNRLTEILERTLSLNSYSLHSEYILCAMLTDIHPDIRMKAVKIILKCREKEEFSVRKFIKPKINFAADDYYMLINSEDWLESILTKYISSACLLEYVNESVQIIDFPKYPSHTQSVERHIRTSFCI